MEHLVLRRYRIRSNFRMAKFLKIMVNQRFRKKYFRIITRFPVFEIFSSVNRDGFKFACGSWCGCL